MIRRLVQNAIIAAVRPYTYKELPGWGALYSMFVGGYEREWLWSDHPTRSIKGKIHGYEMVLNLSRWPDRSAFFLGRWYDLGTQLLLKEVLEIGDVVVDVGANYGMFALVASKFVGSTGEVICFEPNPRCVTHLENLILINGISNISVNGVGLSDETTELTLTIPTINSGEATFGKSQYANVDRISVPVGRGDDYLKGAKPSFIKIDVEGYEYRAAVGLIDTIRNNHPIVITEIVNRHLGAAKTSASEIINLMQGMGYVGLAISTQRDEVTQSLRLHMPTSGQDCDIVWLHADSVHGARLLSTVRR